MDRRSFLNRIGLGAIVALIVPKILESDGGKDFIWIDESDTIMSKKQMEQILDGKSYYPIYSNHNKTKWVWAPPEVDRKILMELVRSE